MSDKESKYQDEARLLMEKTDAEVACVIIINGRKGNGMSAACSPTREAAERFNAALPDLLRKLADKIEGGPPPPIVTVDETVN